MVPAGVTATKHFFTVPLDHFDVLGEAGREGLPKTIKIFCRELVQTRYKERALPVLLFLQGGPGFPSPRPTLNQGWVRRALDEFRVLLLDQRGTGLSTPVSHQTLAALPGPDAQFKYLRCFRADSIVQDCEIVRSFLLGGRRFHAVLGQSYGGFCLLHYLSIAPDAMELALFTGGLPALDTHVDDVYRALCRRVLERNTRFYRRFPWQVQNVRRIVAHLASRSVRMPSGGTLTPRRFLQLGIILGLTSGMETLHFLLEEAFLDELSLIHI